MHGPYADLYIYRIEGRWDSSAAIGGPSFIGHWQEEAAHAERGPGAQVKKKLQAMGYELLDPMQWYIDQLPEEERPPEKPKS